MIRDLLEMIIEISIYRNSDVFYKIVFADMIKGYKEAGAIITASVDQNFITYKIHDVNGKLIHIYLLEM